MTRIELVTSPLPRECSTTELQQLIPNLRRKIQEKDSPVTSVFYSNCPDNPKIGHILNTMSMENETEDKDDASVAGNKKPAQKAKTKSKTDVKNEKRAAALRANLQRRKAAKKS